MSEISRNDTAMAELAQKAWGSLQSGMLVKNKIVSLLESMSIKPDLRSDAIQYQLVHLHNLSVSFVLIKDNLLHYDWWDRYFPGIPGKKEKMENASRFNELIMYGTLIGSFSHLESYVRSIFHAIDDAKKISVGDHFYTVRKALYEKVDILFPELNNYFQLMQAIRNCIHNHGVYFDKKFPDLQVRYKNCLYKFRNGIPPNCVQPEFLIDRINDAIEIIEKTSRNEIVIKIKVIEDRYDLLGSHNTVELLN